MTPGLAEEVTGNDKAALILSDLHCRHLFTYRRDLHESSYQYHALFREFLLAKVQRQYTSEAKLKLIRHTAHILTKHGRDEDAIALYLQATDWDKVIPLLMDKAPQLITQGRAQIVSSWLQCLPQPLVNSTPWLLYWQGVSLIGTQPLDAQETLRLAYSGFEAEGDSIGKVLAASAVLDITYFLRQSLLSAVTWLEAMQRELASCPLFPSPIVECRILTSLISVLMYMRPQDPMLHLYARRLIELLEEDIDANQKVIAGAQLVHYYTMIEGDLPTSERQASKIWLLLTNPEVTPINQILWRVLSSVYPTLKGSQQEAYETVIPLLALVKDNNLEFMESLANLYVLFSYQHFGELDKSHLLLQRMEVLANPTQPADIAWLNLAKATLDLSRRDYRSALDHGTASLKFTTDVGATLIEMGIKCLLATICCELGDGDKAAFHLVLPKAISSAGSPRIKHDVCLIEAYICLNAKQLSRCHATLREAFSIAKERGFFSSWLCWNQRMMSRLCAEALRAGIEPGYVRELIAKRHLTSEDPTLELWPWPVKIYTLGGFRLLIDEQPLAMKRWQQKPLLLLQAIIALGGGDVKIDRVSEILWPDTEGDAAISAFTTTLARLRKLIGDDSVQVSGGRISLDRGRCWVDALTLDYYLDNVKAIDPDFSPAEFATKIVSLYPGAFIRDENEEWAQPFRNKLRKKITRCIQRQLDTDAEGSTKQLHRLLHELRNADGEILP